MNARRQECSSLRQELSQRHNEDSSAALTELARLNDSAMKQAKQRWQEERDRLLKKVKKYRPLSMCSYKLTFIFAQIEELTEQLKSVQNTTAASLEVAKHKSNSQIKELR